jgi:hypothetical protein
MNNIYAARDGCDCCPDADGQPLDDTEMAHYDCPHTSSTPSAWSLFDANLIPSCVTLAGGKLATAPLMLKTDCLLNYDHTEAIGA